MWRALTVYRPLTALYAVALVVVGLEYYQRPAVAFAYLAVLGLWTAATTRNVTGAANCTRRFLFCDLGVALSGILLTPVAVTHQRIVDGGPTLPSIWTAGSVLAFALKGGWRWSAVAAALVGVANVVQRGTIEADTFHDVLLVWVAAIGIGYVVEVARASERTLARALEIEAATRERERLARDIHDGVLQVLAMVQRRGTALGGEAAELGRMAGDQEVALRTLIAGRPAPPAGAHVTPAVGEPPPEPAALDLLALLGPRAGARVTLSGPGAPVVLPTAAARELAAAVSAALDNVRNHAGETAHAWILVEDEGDAVLVTVRDDGPGIPVGRLATAEAEGRLGVALSIKGRLRDLGGSAELFSMPGQGTEVELRVPREPVSGTGA